jgi:hypothetical protein
MRLLISVCLLFGGGISATTQSPPVARKLDSYNDKIRHSEAEMWHLEDFLVPALSADPQSKAYIIAYGGRETDPGKARRYAVRAKNYLVNYRGINPERIVSVDGGRREEFVVELWLVPKDAKPPEPSPTITVPDDLGDNLLFDAFDFGYDNFALKVEDGPARLDAFAAALKKEPNSWGCIVAYAAGGGDGFESDPPGTALRIAREQRAYLVKNHQLPVSRVSVIDGGYGGHTVNLWLMRPGASFHNGPIVSRNRLKTCCRVCARKTGSLTITP